jgi:hypothetical protein
MKTAGYEPDEPQPRDRSGEVIAGRYRLEALLGRGGMGSAYRARHLELDEPVVVKFIDPAYATDPVARGRFRREAKALIRLRHPGVVAMHELGEHEGALFLAMELLEGHTLGARLANRAAPVTLAATFDIFRQLGEVLDAIHTEGVLHRDLKPDNVMLVPARASAGAAHERAVLMDFGLAYLDEKDTKLTATGTAMGTPAYMAPEQCDGTGAGPASDLYALGVMLFETLAGQRPFESQTAALAMSQHMFVAPPKLEAVSASGEDIPPGLALLVDDLLGKKPATRPTAAQFLERLEGARTGSDAAGFAALSSARRLLDLGKTREERALPGAPTVALGPRASVASEPTVLLSDADVVRPRVWLRGFPGERATRLVASLAVNGIEAICAETLATLGPELAGELTVVIVPGSADRPAAELVRQVRDTPAWAQLPVLVVDVPDGAGVAELIRAGASDVALSVLGDDVVVSKTWRLIRRKR